MTDYKRILTTVSHNALRVKGQLPLGRWFESNRRSHFKSLNLNGLGDFYFRGKANYDRNYARLSATFFSSAVIGMLWPSSRRWPRTSRLMTWERVCPEALISAFMALSVAESRCARTQILSLSLAGSFGLPILDVVLRSKVVPLIEEASPV